jgi:hypothetical protein
MYANPGIAVIPDGFWVSNENELYQINSTGYLTVKKTVSLSYVHGIQWDESSSALVLSDASGAIYFYTLESGELSFPIKVDECSPFGIDLDFPVLWIACKTENKIVKFDLSTKSKLFSLKAFGNPVGVASDGKCLWIMDDAGFGKGKIYKVKLKLQCY